MKFKLCLAGIFVFFISTIATAKEALTLANGSKTDYWIVVPKKSTESEKLALRELKFFLGKITKADFPVIKNSDPKVNVLEKRIFLGISGDRKINPGEITTRSSGSDLYLYGDGQNGTLYAVYELLEKQFGCRWLNAFGDSCIPQKSTLTLPGLDISVKYAFSLRAIMIYFYPKREEAALFVCRNRQNFLLEGETAAVNELEFLRPTVHTLSSYVPSGQKHFNKALSWLKGRNYFQTNPEFFSMDEKGERVPDRQLCFSNPGLRRELGKNILEQYKREVLRTSNKSGVVVLECNDIAHKLCCCPECKKLEEKYGVFGGPIFDFLIEICKKHPDIQFRTLAYQRSQTQAPPKNNIKLPKNLMIVFAPINGDFMNTLEDSKINKRDLDDLKNWRKLTGNILLWYYPNTYRRDKEPYDFFTSAPVGNLRRFAKDIKFLHKLGIRGTFFEHDSGGIKLCTNFSELQSYVLLKLFQDPDLDLDILIKEFIHLYYGDAAPLVKQYLDLLEVEREKMNQNNIPGYYNLNHYNYLTKENLKKYNDILERAAEKASGKAVFHVKLLRLGLDSAIITRMDSNEDMKLFEQCVERMRSTLQELKNKRPVKVDMKKFAAWLEAKKKRLPPKPLPKRFAGLNNDDVILVKTVQNTANKKMYIKDNEANFKRAIAEKVKGDVLKVSIYDWGTKKFIATMHLKVNKLSEKYHLYKFPAPIKLVSRASVVAGSWNINARIGKYCSNDNAASLNRKWNVYISLKYNAVTKDIHCDGVYLVDYLAETKKL